MMTLEGKRIYVAGHNGMVGRAIIRRLERENCEILTSDRNTVDLRNQAAVEIWFKKNRPDIVFLAAAKVGGIHANRSFPAQFLYDNLTIAANVIHAAKEYDAQKLLFLGSSCIYPREALQPMQEECLLTGTLEKTNEWYAIAKIAGLKLAQAYCQQYGCNFISCMPTNLYGPYDNYDLQNSHVLPAMLRKIHDAKQQKQESVVLWGTGTPRREFLYVDDLADACVYLVKHYSEDQTINVGVGEDITIQDLAHQIAQVIGYQGEFVYDTNMPDGTSRKLLDITRLKKLGWQAQTDLKTGIKLTYEDYLSRAI